MLTYVLTSMIYYLYWKFSYLKPMFLILHLVNSKSFSPFFCSDTNVTSKYDLSLKNLFKIHSKPKLSSITCFFWLEKSRIKPYCVERSSKMSTSAVFLIELYCPLLCLTGCTIFCFLLKINRCIPSFVIHAVNAFYRTPK